MKIYTRTGDFGETGVIGGIRLDKDTNLIELIGTIDELNANIGIVLSLSKDNEVSSLLKSIQNDLFEIGFELAGLPKSENVKDYRIKKSSIVFLERKVDLYTSKLPMLKNFILPGGSNLSAVLHVARSVCRRSERALVRVYKDFSLTKEVNPLLFAYLNRLSDLLFTLARFANKLNNTSDVVWEHKK